MSEFLSGSGKEAGSEVDIAATNSLRLEPTFLVLLREAISDLHEGLLQWRIWLHLGLNDIRMRYRRSRVGQNWQTLSMAILLLAISIIYSGLLNIDPKVYVAYIVCSFACWNLISALVVESTTVYTGSEGLLLNYSLPKSVCLYQLVVRNFAVFAHNVILVVPVFIVVGVPLNWSMLLIMPALVIYALNGLWVAAVLGALGTRFRDVPTAIGSIMHIIFILTPVVYTVESMGVRQRIVADWNPFARMLAIGRDPLLGKFPSDMDYIVSLVVTVAGCIVAMVVFAKTRRKVLYWL